MAKLIRNVFVRGHGWFGPAYPDAGHPPRGAVSNPQCWDGGDASVAEPSAADTAPENPQPAVVDDGPPPRSGKGSSDAAWTEYALRRGVQVSEEMSRSEVIAACDAAGVPTK